MAYAVGSKATSASGLETPVAEVQPVLKKVRLEPRKGFSLVVPVTDSKCSAVDTPWPDSAEGKPGTSGPEVSDGSFEFVSSGSRDVKMIDSDSS